MNESKAQILDDLLADYQQAVNHYVESFIGAFPGSRKNCYKDHDSGCLRTKRLEDNAAMTAYDIVHSWLKGPRKSRPFFYGGTWWPLEFHHGVEPRTPKLCAHVSSCMGSG